MPANVGTFVIAEIVTPDTLDTFPTHRANLGLGGMMNAYDLNERDAIPVLRRQEGMCCYVLYDNYGYILQETYQLIGGITNADWVIFSGGLIGPYLLLDQTTPQTVINGAPNFEEGLTVINLDATDIAPSITPTIQFGFSWYNDAMKRTSQTEWIDSGALYGRTQGTRWQYNQTINPDGTYSYDWDAAPGGNHMDDLINNGFVQIYMILGTTTTGGPTIPNLYSTYESAFTNPSAYADWVRTLALRWKGKVKYYTIENEPDFNFSKYDRFYKNASWNATARNFVNMFIMASKAIKLVDPDAKVVFNCCLANMNPNPDFNAFKGLDAMLELGAGNYFDIVDLHFYARHEVVDGVYVFKTPGEHFVWEDCITRIKNTLITYGYTDKEFWIGESGVGTGLPSDPLFASRVANQSLEMVKQYAKFMAQGITTILNVLIWDTTVNPLLNWNNFRFMGIMTYYLVKKATYYVFQKITSIFNGTTFVSSTNTGGVEIYKFTCATYDVYTGFANVAGTLDISITLGQTYTSGKIIDAIALTETDIDPTDLESGDVVTTATAWDNPKYIYLVK